MVLKPRPPIRHRRALRQALTWACKAAQGRRLSSAVKQGCRRCDDRADVPRRPKLLWRRARVAGCSRSRLREQVLEGRLCPCCSRRCMLLRRRLQRPADGWWADWWRALYPGLAVGPESIEADAAQYKELLPRVSHCSRASERSNHSRTAQHCRPLPRAHLFREAE